jgi:hypothetical protein
LPYSQPPEGVHAYRTSGGESISLLGASHTYPAETYASVVHESGCAWRNEFDIAQEDIDTLTRCSEPGRLLESDDRRSITFFGQTETEDLRCEPPIVIHDIHENIGAILSGVSRSNDTTARVRSTYLGHETLTIGGVAVDAGHITARADATGRATGTATDEEWIRATDGLILRRERAEDADATAAFGSNVHYHERASFRLESLTTST